MWRCLAVVTITFLTGACGSAPAPAKAPPAAGGHAAANAMLQRVGTAIVARDYALAYGEVAVEARGELTLADFQEAIEPYRERYEGGLRFTTTTEPFDPSGASTVPEALRGRITSEGSIEFQPPGDEEGFTMVVWVMMESGVPKLASFYVGD